MNLWFVGIIVFLINIPFGYWRSNVRKFSFQWILSIHIPVPFIIVLRYTSGIGFAFITYPVLVGAFFIGQFAGKLFHKRWENHEQIPLTSCLACDLLNYTLLKVKKKRI